MATAGTLVSVRRVDLRGCVEDSEVALYRLWALARVLKPRERLVLWLRSEGDLTQEEIGDRIGIRQMQVSCILRSSIERLRRSSGCAISTTSSMIVRCARRLDDARSPAARPSGPSLASQCCAAPQRLQTFVDVGSKPVATQLWLRPKPGLHRAVARPPP